MPLDLHGMSCAKRTSGNLLVSAGNAYGYTKVAGGACMSTRPKEMLNLSTAEDLQIA